MQCPCLRDATQIFYMYMYCISMYVFLELFNAAPSEPRCTVSMAWTSAMSLTVCEYDCTHVVHRDPDPTGHLHVVTELIMCLQCSLFQHCYASTVVDLLNLRTVRQYCFVFRGLISAALDKGMRSNQMYVDLLCQIAQPGKPLSGAHNNMTVYNVRVMSAQCSPGSRILRLPGAAQSACIHAVLEVQH